MDTIIPYYDVKKHHDNLYQIGDVVHIGYMYYLCNDIDEFNTVYKPQFIQITKEDALRLFEEKTNSINIF